MRKFLWIIATFVTFIVAVAVQPLQAAPRQLVIVVAEGVNPQVIEFGTSYIRKAFEQEEATAVEELETSGKTQTGEAGAQAALQGVLKAASANGYKTMRRRSPASMNL